MLAIERGLINLGATMAVVLMWLVRSFWTRWWKRERMNLNWGEDWRD